MHITNLGPIKNIIKDTLHFYDPLPEWVIHDCAGILDAMAKPTSCPAIFHIIHNVYITIHITSVVFLKEAQIHANLLMIQMPSIINLIILAIQMNACFRHSLCMSHTRCA